MPLFYSSRWLPITRIFSTRFAKTGDRLVVVRTVEVAPIGPAVFFVVRRSFHRFLLLFFPRPAIVFVVFVGFRPGSHLGSTCFLERVYVGVFVFFFSNSVVVG